MAAASAPSVRAASASLTTASQIAGVENGARRGDQSGRELAAELNDARIVAGELRGLDRRYATRCRRRGRAARLCAGGCWPCRALSRARPVRRTRRWAAGEAEAALSLLRAAGFAASTRTRASCASRNASRPLVGAVFRIASSEVAAASSEPMSSAFSALANSASTTEARPSRAFSCVGSAASTLR
jgi:hypothetical protein